MNVIPLIGDFSEQEQNAWLTQLNTLLPSNEVIPFDQLTDAQKQTAVMAIAANPHPDKLNQLPALIWVHSLWAGVEKLIEPFRQRSLKLVRLEDPELAKTMAEAVVTCALYLHRNLHRYEEFQKDRLWAPQLYTAPETQKVAILGLGNLGLKVAQRLLDNKFSVIGWSRQQKKVSQYPCYFGADGFKQVLSSADIIVSLLPLTDETQNLINEKSLSLCKQSASIINFGRGGVIDSGALLTWLNSNREAYAILDVFDTEPLPVDDLFWHHPQIKVLPHISAPTQIESASQIVASRILNYFESGDIPPTVDLLRGY